MGAAHKPLLIMHSIIRLLTKNNCLAVALLALFVLKRYYFFPVVELFH